MHTTFAYTHTHIHTHSSTQQTHIHTQQYPTDTHIHTTVPNRHTYTHSSTQQTHTHTHSSTQQTPIIPRTLNKHGIHGDQMVPLTVAVPLPNSSMITSERSVQFRTALETWKISKGLISHDYHVTIMRWIPNSTCVNSFCHFTKLCCLEQNNSHQIKYNKHGGKCLVM